MVLMAGCTVFGLPEVRNAVCGALAVDRPHEVRALIEDPTVECSSCLAATPPRS